MTTFDDVEKKLIYENIEKNYSIDDDDGKNDICKFYEESNNDKWKMYKKYPISINYNYIFENVEKNIIEVIKIQNEMEKMENYNNFPNRLNEKNEKIEMPLKNLKRVNTC